MSWIFLDSCHEIDPNSFARLRTFVIQQAASCFDYIIYCLYKNHKQYGHRNKHKPFTKSQSGDGKDHILPSSKLMSPQESFPTASATVRASLRY